MSRPRDNRSALVRLAVTGRIAPPRVHVEVAAYDDAGRQAVLPGTGGIALGVHAGDAVEAWLGDHLMPGASVEDVDTDPAVAGPLHQFCCIGNVVRDAAGRPIGIVAGKRGGLAPGFWPPHLVGVELDDTEAERLAPGDRVVVEAVGRGLALLDHPEIGVSNLSARALDALSLRQDAGCLVCGVAALLPPEVAGAGLGQDSWVGDVEIADASRVTAGSLAGLRFGDLVALGEMDGRSGRFYRPGHLAVGVVSHGPSPVPGHGVGLTLVLSGPSERLRVEVEAGAGLGAVLRRWARDLAQG